MIVYLIHWPVPLNPKGNHPVFPMLENGNRDIDLSWNISDTWKQMEAVYKSKKVRSIGISNFSEKKIEEVLATAEIVPAVNQLEIHLYNPQHKLMDYLHKKGIVPQAYSPLGSSNSPLFKDELVVELTKKYSTEPANILLAYLLAKDIVVLPKSVTPERIRSNLVETLRVYAKLKADEADVKQLDGVAAAGKQKRFITPPWGIDLGFDNWP